MDKAITDLLAISRWFLESYKADRNEWLALPSQLSDHDFIDNFEFYITVFEHAYNQIGDVNGKDL